jgi:aminopeptidase YwaD
LQQVNRYSMRQYFIFIFLGIISTLDAQEKLNPEITASDLQHYMYYLASDSLNGRFPGSNGGNDAAKYIASHMKYSGLQLYNKTGFQYFDVLTNQEPGLKSKLQINRQKYKINQDFALFPFSSNGTVNASIVFAGYGFDIKNDSFQWNDYANIDVKGKIVVLLRGTPDSEKYQNLLTNYSDDIVKAINARDHGALAVVLVSGKKFDNQEKMVEMNLKESSAGIPVILLKRSVANTILVSANTNIDELENKIQVTFQPVSFILKNDITITTEIIKHTAQTCNVIGYVYARDTSITKSYLIIGAHYDHLGMGGPGSPSRMQDTVAIHNGADDNASGVCTLLELAGKFPEVRDSLKQNIIFIAFGAEEMGILGSKYFTEHIPIPVSNVKAMINLDMVGRLNEDTLLQVNGTGTSKEATDMITTLNKSYHFNLRMSPEGYGPSDHASFYAKNIPVFFLTTGAHTDYHTPFDDREKINYAGLEKVSHFSFDLATRLAFSDSKLTFQEAGPQKAASGGRRYKITLGIMPDVNGSIDNGLLVEFVTKGKPAYNGGMLKGDIITSVEGKPVKNIQDYMVRLSQLKAGQTVHVEVLRKNKTELLIIQL